MNAVQIYHQIAPFVGRGQSATPRQMDEVARFLNGLLPDVPLDTPTLMALILVFAFIVQFYWTLISITLNENAASSSSSSTTTTTTTTTTTAAPRIIVNTVAALRTQTVTPAPAPEWRHFLRDFDLPHWVNKRSADVQASGIRYKQRDRKPSSRNAGVAQSVKSRQGRHRLSYGRVDQMWEKRPFMDLEYDSSDAVGRWMDEEVPVELSSHRMVSLPFAEISEGSSEVAANMLHAAERWGSRLEEWHVISPEGGQVLTQTILMMRCALGWVAFCAKLDHHFRRQHDLNLAAAMMNYPYEDKNVVDSTGPYDQNSQGSFEIHEQWHPEEPDRTLPVKEEADQTLSLTDRSPGRLYKVHAVPPHTGKVVVKAQRRHSKQHDDESSEVKKEEQKPPKAKKDEKDNTRRVSNPGGVGKSNWNLYFFMSVMAVLVFLMDASYRILRVVSSSAGRALQDPHQDVLATLMTAVRRWETINAESHM